jgi:hypothetical protein
VMSVRGGFAGIGRNGPPSPGDRLHPEALAVITVAAEVDEVATLCAQGLDM